MPCFTISRTAKQRFNRCPGGIAELKVGYLGNQERFKKPAHVGDHVLCV